MKPAKSALHMLKSTLHEKIQSELNVVAIFGTYKRIAISSNCTHN